MIRRTMEFCLRAHAAILGLIGLFAVVLALRNPDPSDRWTSVLALSSALLLPPVMYLFVLPRYLRADAQGRSSPRSEASPPGPFALVLSAVLFFPLMILLASDLQVWRRVLGAIPLLAVMWLFCAYSYQWLREDQQSPANRFHLPRDLRDCLETTSRLLGPPVLLVLGAAALFFCIWSEDTLLKSGDTWITAEYGLGAQIPSAKLFLNYLGRFVYWGSVLLSGCTIVLLLGSKFSTARLRSSRATIILGLFAGFLAVCSITDYYFSWLSFLVNENLPVVVLSPMHRILFTLLFLQWIMPLLFAFAIIRAPQRASEDIRLGLKIFIAFYMPLLLFDLAMTPFFVSDFFSRFILFTFLGLQFLLWGYLQLLRNGVLNNGR